MRKLLFVLAFAGISVASMAQNADATEKYSVATNSFGVIGSFRLVHSIQLFTVHRNTALALQRIR